MRPRAGHSRSLFLPIWSHWGPFREAKTVPNKFFEGKKSKRIWGAKKSRARNEMTVSSAQCAGPPGGGVVGDLRPGLPVSSWAPTSACATSLCSHRLWLHVQLHSFLNAPFRFRSSICVFIPHSFFAPQWRFKSTHVFLQSPTGLFYLLFLLSEFPASAVCSGNLVAN
jgi:hypothetical protein